MFHITESQQFSRKGLEHLFEEADGLRVKQQLVLQGNLMASLFYEPSTRTRFSFEAAMHRLGGGVLTTENAQEFSSAAKGESLEDSIRIIGSYCDVIVIRHPEKGAAERASKVSRVPIINAGDGGGQHPTQALLDMYTIYKEFGRLDDLKVAAVGDLANGRTIRSLCYLLGKFSDIEMTFVSPENLKMKEDIKRYLTRHNISFREESDLNKVLPEVDIIYMTRIQKERMLPEEYEKVVGQFVIDESNLPLVRDGSRIMHPLPHVEELNLPLHVEENDERVAYFRQAENGLYTRMALLSHILRKTG